MAVLQMLQSPALCAAPLSEPGCPEISGHPFSHACRISASRARARNQIRAHSSSRLRQDPLRKAAAFPAEASGEEALMKATTGIAACCALAASGHAAAEE